MEKSGRSLAQFYELLFKLDKRITSLEKDCTFIEKKIISIGKDRIDKYNILGIELNDLRASLVNVKKSIRTNVIGLIKISSDMQGAVKKDQIDQLNNQLEDIKFVEYLTKNDLKKNL